ncbi:malonyl-CoA decarboxylase [Vandammella animalimorsus]|nr:malonyl-CoA decarboxylase [Vandammella animalimorsus]
MPPTTLSADSQTDARGLGLMRLWRRFMGGREHGEEVASASEALDKRQWQKIDTLLHEAATQTDSDSRVRARARQLLDAYLHANAADRLLFMLRLAQGFHVDKAALDRAITAYQAASEGPESLRAQAELAQALESPRLRVLRQFNLLPNGIHALVQMRAELLRSAHQEELQPLEQDLLRLFTLWFDAGFLELQRIGWGSPASLLEKVIRYEAVHEIKSWNDLRNRLDSDRRCYAFFHGRMPDEPLIFVEVALVKALADNVQALLDEAQPTQDPAQATTAIFYSISNAQSGLRGVSMGEFLIKRVVEQLTHEFPKLQKFATLSPVPGFAKWLQGRLEDAQYRQRIPLQVKLLIEEEEQGAQAPLERLRQLLRAPQEAAQPGQQSAGEALGKDDMAALRQWLMAECAHYLLLEKRRQEPLDPVARFHFGNGASLQQINWMGDSSDNGMRQSLGLMVNYLYRLDAIDEQYQAYAREGKLAYSPEVKKLLASKQPQR